MPRRIAGILVVVAAIAAIVALRARTEEPPPPRDAPGAADARFERYAAPAMATTIEVLVPAGADGGADAAEAVFAVFREVDARMSEWKATSPLSAVNRAAGRGPAAVPDDLRAVVRRGVEIGELTGGAFDVTWAALWGLWDFKAAEPRVPEPDAITERTALVDYRAVVIDDEAGTVELPREGMLLGLGGIAKGCALDRAAATLRARGVEDFLISAGGQMIAGGRRGDRPWRVGVRDPRGGPGDYFAQVEAEDVSVSTSGDYERFFEKGGVRYHHVLDPRTGRPARAGVRSATVISADATRADALSTALVIMGVEDGLALVEALDGVETVMVDGAGEVHASGGLAERLTIVHPPRR